MHFITTLFMYRRYVYAGYFVFRPNGTNYIQCLKDKINPTCGPDTYAALLKESLSQAPPDYYDDACRNMQGKMSCKADVMHAVYRTHPKTQHQNVDNRY